MTLSYAFDHSNYPMKVICTKRWEKISSINEQLFEAEVGKTYDIILLNKYSDISICDEENKQYSYYLTKNILVEHFDSVEELREEKINRILK